MQHDNFESNHQTSYDKKDGSDGKHKFSPQRKPSDNENEYPSHQARERQKTTAIALSVITCLFMCVIGYEIIRETQPATNDLSLSGTSQQSSLILAKPSYDYIAEANTREDHESQEIQRLRDQNRAQANKIKALQQELVEKVQSSHEIKSNLFRLESDPKDRLKINELSQKLSDAERTNFQLGLTVTTLQNELLGIESKMNQAEVTRDALAAMLATHRTTKEQEIAEHQKKIEELEAFSTQSQTDLLRKIDELDFAKQNLANSLEEKSAALAALEAELLLQKDLHTAKSHELNNIVSLYSASQKELNEQILSLTATLEWETAKHQSTADRLDKKIENQAYVLSVLESAVQSRNLMLNEKHELISKQSHEIASRDEQLANHKAELEEFEAFIIEKEMQWEELDQHLAAADDFQQKAQEIITTLEWETARSASLEQELQNLSKQQRYTLQEKNDLIQTLERELNKQRNVLETKSFELEQISHKFEASQLDKTALQEAYESQTEVLALAKEETEKLSTEAQRAQELDQLTTQLKNEIEEKETTIKALQIKWEAAKDSQDKVQKSLEKDIQDLTVLLEQESSSYNALEAEWQKLKDAHTSAQEEKVHEKLSEAHEQIQNLDHQIRTFHDSMTAKEHEIHALVETKNQFATEVSEQLNQLEMELEKEKLRADTIKARYLEVKDESKSLMNDSKKLDNKYKAAVLKLRVLEDQVALHRSSYNTDLKEYQVALEKLNNELIQEKQKNEEANARLKELEAGHVAEQTPRSAH